MGPQSQKQDNAPCTTLLPSVNTLHCQVSIQYNYTAKCQYNYNAKCQCNCTRNVLWCQVHSSHIHAHHKTSLNYNTANRQYHTSPRVLQERIAVEHYKLAFFPPLYFFSLQVLQMGYRSYVLLRTYRTVVIITRQVPGVFWWIDFSYYFFPSNPQAHIRGR